VDQQGERYVISGPTPTLDAEAVSSEGVSNGFKEGWYSFDAQVSTAKGTLFFFLYLGRTRDGQKGFNEGERFLLSFDHNKATRQLVWIPEGITSLRLEVYDFDGEFSISNPQLRALGSLNVVGLFFNKQIRPLLVEPRMLLAKLKKALYCFREGGFAALKIKMFGGRVTTNYNEWVSRFDNLSVTDLEAVKVAAQRLQRQPKISIVTPVFNPPIHHFRLCLDSVLGQAYQNWELCLADDCSTDPEVRKVIDEYCAKDTRIKAVYRDKTGHISAATKSAIAMAT
jgi:hypothetical protein